MAIKYLAGERIIGTSGDRAGTDTNALNNLEADGVTRFRIDNHQKDLDSIGGVTTTIDGDYTVVKFTGDGSFTPNGSFNIDYLVVGGGGGGGGTKPSGAGMGGGGAGGYKYVTGFGVTAQKYEVKVGQGGSGGNFKNDVFGSEGSSGYYCQGRNGDESAIYPTNGTYNYNPLTGGIYDNYTGSADSDILTRNNTSYGRNYRWGWKVQEGHAGKYCTKVRLSLKFTGSEISGAKYEVRIWRGNGSITDEQKDVIAVGKLSSSGNKYIEYDDLTSSYADYDFLFENGVRLEKDDIIGIVAMGDYGTNDGASGNGIHHQMTASSTDNWVYNDWNSVSWGNSKHKFNMRVYTNSDVIMSLGGGGGYGKSGTDKSPDSQTVSGDGGSGGGGGWSDDIKDRYGRSGFVVKNLYGNDARTLGDNGNRYGIAQKISAGHPLIGRKVTRLIAWLKKDQGSPTGTLYCRIRQADGTLRETATTLDVSTIPSSGSSNERPYSFTFSTGQVIAAGDLLSWEYASGGSANINLITKDSKLETYGELYYTSNSDPSTDNWAAITNNTLKYIAISEEGQGNDGGINLTNRGSPFASAGGGGAGAAGSAAASNNEGGAGGAGLANSITGTSTYYAGGGGGGVHGIGVRGIGGSGIGGLGGCLTKSDGTASSTQAGYISGNFGSPNTGSGGGGGGGADGGAGADGVVIIRYLTSAGSIATTEFAKLNGGAFKFNAYSTAGTAGNLLKSYDNGDGDYFGFHKGGENRMIPQSGDWSVSMWVWADRNGGQDESSHQELLTISSENLIRIQYHATDSAYQNKIACNFNSNTLYGGVLPQREWAHVVVTRSAGTVDIWVNGVKSTNSSFGNSSTMPSSYPIIGRNFKGYLCDIGIWHEKITDANVASLHASGAGAIVTTIPTTNLKAWYKGNTFGRSTAFIQEQTEVDDWGNFTNWKRVKQVTGTGYPNTAQHFRVTGMSVYLSKNDSGAMPNQDPNIVIAGAGNPEPELMHSNSPVGGTSSDGYMLDKDILTTTGTWYKLSTSMGHLFADDSNPKIEWGSGNSPSTYLRVGYSGGNSAIGSQNLMKLISGWSSENGDLGFKYYGDGITNDAPAQDPLPISTNLTNGTIFEESDTGKHYMFDGTSAWNEVS